MKTIMLITNIPTPYRIPLFNELKKQLENEGCKFKVIFGARGYARRKWDIHLSECNFNFFFLPSKMMTLRDSESTIFLYRNLYKVLKKDKPNLIITPAFSFATTKLWLLSYFKKINYVIWSGAVIRKNREGSFLRKMQRRILIKRAKGFVAYGKKAREYLIQLGADPDKIEIAINTVDTAYFKLETEKLRNKFNTMKDRCLLYVGNITEGKRIDLLIHAVKVLLKMRSDFVLKLVGDGFQLEKIKNLARELGILDFISFEGYKQKKEIPKYLAEADCFLFPSEYDVWGLSLVEAMSAGLPCISSIHSGATHDLIKDGVTGFAVDFFDKEKVADRITWILDNPELAEKIGQNAESFIAENATLEKSAEGFVQAVTKIRD